MGVFVNYATLCECSDLDLWHFELKRFASVFSNITTFQHVHSSFNPHIFWGWAWCCDHNSLNSATGFWMNAMYGLNLSPWPSGHCALHSGESPWPLWHCAVHSDEPPWPLLHCAVHSDKLHLSNLLQRHDYVRHILFWLAFYSATNRTICLSCCSLHSPTDLEFITPSIQESQSCTSFKRYLNTLFGST